MTHIRALLIDITASCLQIVGLAWLAAAVYFALRLPASWRARLAQFARTLLPEPWLLIGVPVLALAIRLVPHETWTRLTFWNPVLAAFGVACIAASSGLMLWARWVLGSMWAGRPLVQQDHELRTDGPYGLVRHPIYAGILGCALGGTLVAGFGPMLLVLPFTVAFVVWRVRVEDRMMTSTFGQRYDAYRGTVRALVPVPQRAAGTRG